MPIILPKIYILSGLGADERVFQLLDFEGMEVVFIKWITPTKHEPIAAYAQRPCAQINTEKPILIGLSFGGMVAIEIAKQIATEKVILLSSVKTKSEIPFYIRLMGKMGAHNLVPIRFLKHANLLANWAFGLITVFEKRLMKLILLDMDEQYVRWAIHQVFTWQNETVPHNLTHIHGTADRIFPIRNIKADYEIKNGGHFMVLNKHKEVSNVIREVILK